MDMLQLDKDDEEEDEDEDFTDDAFLNQFGRGVESAKTLVGNLGIINRKMKDMIFNVNNEKGQKRLVRGLSVRR